MLPINATAKQPMFLNAFDLKYASNTSFHRRNIGTLGYLALNDEYQLDVEFYLLVTKNYLLKDSSGGLYITLYKIDSYAAATAINQSVYMLDFASTSDARAYELLGSFHIDLSDYKAYVDGGSGLIGLEISYTSVSQKDARFADSLKDGIIFSTIYNVYKYYDIFKEPRHG